MPFAVQLIHNTRTDEPGRPGYEDVHPDVLCVRTCLLVIVKVEAACLAGPGRVFVSLTYSESVSLTYSEDQHVHRMSVFSNAHVGFLAVSWLLWGAVQWLAKSLL